MKEAIGGTAIFQIVIVFILLFTGFMCLSINRSKAFNVKDKIIQTIQAYNGLTDEAREDIAEYLRESSYRTTGRQPEKEIFNGKAREYDCYGRDGNSNLSDPVFCVLPVPVEDDACSEGMECFNELPSMAYYRVVVFYQLDLPVFHDFFNFKVVGDTKILYGGEIS